MNTFDHKYELMMKVAVLGNSLVLMALTWSRELRKSPRNILIGTLATSDLLLCCTMPLTAIDVLTKSWPFGKNSVILCKIVKLIKSAFLKINVRRHFRSAGTS